MLVGVLQELQTTLGIPNDIRTKNPDLATLLAVLPGADNSIATAIELTGKLRNTVGHNLGWDDRLSSREYRDLAGKVGAACLHAIATLYVPKT